MAAPMEPTTVLKLLQILMSPTSGTQNTDHEKNTATDDRGRFDISLHATILAFRDELSKAYNTSTVAQEINKEFPHPPENCKYIRWQFVLYCLKMMKLLKESTKKSMDEFKQSQQQVKLKTLGPNNAPPLSPDTLSFGQQKTIMTALQFITCLGIVPNLQEGVGIPLERRSGFGSILSGSQMVSEEERCVRLLQIIRVLIECIEQPSLGGLILSRHMGDLLAGLLQLVHSPLTRTKTHSEGLAAGSSSDGSKNLGAFDNRTSRGNEPCFQSPADIGCLQTSNVQSQNTFEGCKTSNSHTDDSIHLTNDLNVVDDDDTLCKTDNISGEAHFTEHDIIYCKDQLQKLVTKSYQPGVIKELLLLQGGPGGGNKKPGKMSLKNPLPRAPRWLTKVCGELLSERLMQPKGVHNVLKAVLDAGGGQGVTGQTPNWEKCDAVAKLIASCPLQSDSVESYYKLICPQVLKLLHIKDQLVLQQTLRVACTCIAAVVDQHPKIADQHLIEPLLKPLLDTLSCNEVNYSDKPEGSVIPVISESILGKCIDCIYKVFVIGVEPNSQLIPTMGRVVDPLFKLYCFARQGVCNLRATVEELLLTFFKLSEKAISLQYLKHMTFIEKDSDKTTMHSHVTFVPGSEGGALAVYRVSVSPEELFTESLMNQENVADAVLTLLQHLKREALSGDYFILLLQELTCIISKPPDTSSTVQSTATSSKQLLDLEHQQVNQILHLQHSLQILAILSKMCESLGPDLLENTGHILSFVKATLERACQSLEAEDADDDAFETETLTMAFGLTSAILTGEGEKKVTTENKQVLMDLIPLLEQISSQHPQQPICVMATELRITVATHGAVWSENMKDTIQQLRTKAQQRYLEEKSKPKQTAASEQTKSGKKKLKDDAITKTNIRQGVTFDDDEKSRHVDSEEDVISKEFDEAFQELFDPLLPVRGHALIALAKLLQAHDTKAMQKKDALLKIFEENVTHEDSYIYLSAIKGLVALVEVFPDKVVPKLCAEFVGFQKESAQHRTVETRLKIGEALVKATRCLGELVPHYSQQLLGALLVGTRDSDASVRASSLSNIGDVCQLLRFSLGPIVHEIMNCVTSLLKTDPEVEVRRACVLVITLVLKGLGSDALKVLEGVIRDLYRQLKLVITVEKDGALLLHAQLALEELDIIMKNYLFPKQTLSKKITVLP